VHVVEACVLICRGMRRGDVHMSVHCGVGCRLANICWYEPGVSNIPFVRWMLGRLTFPNVNQCSYEQNAVFEMNWPRLHGALQ